MVQALSPKPCQRSSVKRQRIVFLLGNLQGTCFSTVVFLVTGVVLARQCIQHVKTSEEGLSQTPAGNTSRLVNRSNEICQFFAGSARNMACWLAGRSQDTVADGATARKLKHYPCSYTDARRPPTYFTTPHPLSLFQLQMGTSRTMFQSQKHWLFNKTNYISCLREWNEFLVYNTNMYTASKLLVCLLKQMF